MLNKKSKSSSSIQGFNDKKLLFLDTMLELSHESEEALKKEDLSFQDKLTALSRLNTAQKKLYGENSINAFRSEKNLGFFLNEHQKPELAIKHLNAADSISKNIDNVEKEESMAIAIETANAYLSLDKNNTEQAEEALKPYSDIEVNDPNIRYKRDLAQSQIYLSKKDYPNALKNLKSAQTSLGEFNEDEKSEKEAALYQAMSQIKNCQKSQSNLNKIRELTTTTDNGQKADEESTKSENRVKFDIPAPKSRSIQNNESQQQNDETTPSFLKNFELLDQIGQGAFGKVYKVKDKTNGNIYAAKISKLSRSNNNQQEADTQLYLKREVNLLANLNHPSILKFICYSPVNFKNKPKPVIITEYAENHALSDLIKMERESRALDDWNNTRKVIVLYGIASAMAFLHEKNIVHRDLKPNNILMDTHLHPKIADFGLSKVIHRNDQSMTTKSMAGQKGTPIYMAPEIWSSPNPEYSEKTDVYAFGMIAYEVITNDQPYDDLDDPSLVAKIQKDFRPTFKSDIPEVYQYLIQSCWDKDPEKRPTFYDIAQQLRNDQEFRDFDMFDDDEFDKYVDFLDEYQSTFENNPQDISEFISRHEQTFKSISVVIQPEPVATPKAVKTNDLLCPEDYYNQLDEDRKKLIEEAENDPIKQCIVGQFLVEGIEGFPQETDVGIQYLDRAIKANCTEACTYYCNLLIRGQFVDYNLELAKTYLETQLKSHDGTVYLLYGRVNRKLENFDVAQRYFKKGANLGNSDAMYEYGKMMYRGEGCDKNEEEANVYFDLAKKNGNYKAYEFVFKQQKEEERRRKRNEQNS